ncbi:unnamed protein product [Cunninghamella blakesleeana]
MDPTIKDTYDIDPFSVPVMETNFSIMFVSIGLSCFIWQATQSGWLFYKSRKIIFGLVFSQTILGIAVTIVTLLTSLVPVDCTFRLLFSVIGVNLGDISLQFILLWKAYLGNNRSKIILYVGITPLIGIFAFIALNITIGRSETYFLEGVCATVYPDYIVVVKAVLDFFSNIFLSACFLLVIYRHYRVLGSGIQRTLIKEGLIYCFGVCISNIATGICMFYRVLGGSTPVLYTIDWYLASYLIIKQLKYGRNTDDEDEENIEFDEEDMRITQFSNQDLELSSININNNQRDIPYNDEKYMYSPTTTSPTITTPTSSYPNDHHYYKQKL